MDSEEIVYYPHVMVYWLAVPLIPLFLLFSLYFVNLCANKLVNFSTLFALFSALVCLLLARQSIKLSRCVAIFQPDGIYCVNMGRNAYNSFSWNNFGVAYICYDTKGNKYLVLSAVPLDNRKVKRLANRGTTVTQRESNTVVLYIKPTNEHQITEFIKQRMPIIYRERYFSGGQGDGLREP